MGTTQPLKLTRMLWVSTALVSLLGLAAELVYLFGQATPLHRKLVPFFSLSEEANFPTWYSASLLLAASLLLFAIARSHRTDETKTLHWRCLGVIFLYMSLDESVQLHEHLGSSLKTSGVLYFSWVIPAGIAVVLLGLLYLPFLKALPSSFRWGFMIAGALYVGGALLMELPLGAWAELHGHDNPTYALLDWVEETLEMAGVSVFLVYLYRYWTDEGTHE